MRVTRGSLARRLQTAMFGDLVYGERATRRGWDFHLEPVSVRSRLRFDPFDPIDRSVRSVCIDRDRSIRLIRRRSGLAMDTVMSSKFKAEGYTGELWIYCRSRKILILLTVIVGLLHQFYSSLIILVEVHERNPIDKIMSLIRFMAVKVFFGDAVSDWPSYLEHRIKCR